MESVLSLKMLGVLALVLLVSSMNEGRIVSKCELKAQLDAAFGANMNGNMTQDTPANMTGNMTQSVPRNMTGNMTGDLIARLVCVVERTSRFNTSLISTIQLPPQPQNTPKPDGPHQKPGEKPDDSNEERPGGKPGDSNEERPGGKPGDSNEERPGGKPGDSNGGRPGGKPGDSNGGRPGGKPGDSNGGRPGGKPGDSNGGRPGGKPGDSNGGRPGGKPGDSKSGSKPRGKRSPPRAPRGGHDKPPTGSSGVLSGITMNLYGIFQLSDQVACDSGSNQTLNICRMNCTALIDDDIRDDIACLKTLMGDMSNVMDVMFVEECRSVVPSQYFAVCV